MFEIDHWKVETQFSADEIGALYVGHDPREIGDTVTFRTIEPIRRRINTDYSRACHAVERICIAHHKDEKIIISEANGLLSKSGFGLFSVGLVNQIENLDFFHTSQDVMGWIKSRYADVDDQKFSREEIHKWLLGEGLESKFDFAKSKNLGFKEDLSRGKWPWGSHTSTNLEMLADAGIQWWSSYEPDDPSTAPISQDVAEWLVKKYNMSMDRARYFASILRADGLPSGRRPRSNRSHE